MEKLHSYQGWSGRIHEMRDDIRTKISTWRESHEGDNIVDLTKNYARKISTGRHESGKDDDFSHIYRSVLWVYPPTPPVLYFIFRTRSRR